MSKQVLYSLFAAIGVAWLLMLLVSLVWQWRFMQARKLRLAPDWSADDPQFIEAVDQLGAASILMRRALWPFGIVTAGAMLAIMVLNN